MLYLLLIINKAGGLIYHHAFSHAENPLAKLSSNEYLVLAGMLHGIHAISTRLSPTATSGRPNLHQRYIIILIMLLGNRGLEEMTTPQFTLHTHTTPTGLKFIVLTNPSSQRLRVDTCLRQVQKSFGDFACKNPFWSLDMPIRCELFDLAVEKLGKSAWAESA